MCIGISSSVYYVYTMNATNIRNAQLSLTTQKLRALSEEEERVCINPMNQFISSIRDIASILFEVSSDSNKHPNDSEYPRLDVKECYKKLDQVMKQVCIVKSEAEKRAESIYNARKDVQIMGDSNAILNTSWIDSFENQNVSKFNNQLDNSDWLSWKRLLHEMDIDFIFSLQSEEDDITVTLNVESFICPITQATFIQPVKNQKCGHSYSKAAIEQLINSSKSRSFVVCPVSGCQCRIVLKNLVPDIKLEKRLINIK